FQVMGEAEVSLQFTAERTQLNLACLFTNTTIELDLFDMFAEALKGTTPPDQMADTENSIDLDIDIRFDLNKIGLQLGSVATTPTAAQVAFQLDIGLVIAGIHGDISLELSNQHFALGLKSLTIPLDIPKFPLHLSDLTALQGSDGLWDYENRWQQGERPILKAEAREATKQIEQTKIRVAQLENTLNAMNMDDPASSTVAAELFELKYDQLPDLNKEAFRKAAKLFLIDAIFVFDQMTQNRHAYQTLVAAYQTVVDQTIGMIHLDTGLALNLFDVRIRLPFNNPADIALEGGAKLQGFNADSFLAPLNEVGFKLGLSAEYIYFYIDTGEEGLQIEFPDVGYYEGAAVTLDHFQFGYGFSKNALNVVIAGGFDLPERLVEDFDTSDQVGVGLRLPVRSRLLFHLDLIPIVLGEVDFLLPLIEFDIDLRRDGRTLPPGPECQPSWDGLQLHVPNIMRVGLKRMRYSPFFGPLPAHNYTQSYDIDLGTKDIGLTLICDNYFVIMPIAGYFPIPLLADGLPFFDNYCLVMRLGGFAVKMHLQRPFLSLSPMLMFELFGLLSDPEMPIDPAGTLAQMMRFSVTNSYMTIPAAVLRMFPELGNEVRRELDFSINLGHGITFFQQTKALIDTLLEQANETAGDIQTFINDIQNNPPDMSPQAALALLPPALRRIETHGSLGGFMASATLLLITPDELTQAFRERENPPVPPASPSFPINDSVDPPQIGLAPLDTLSNYEPTYTGGYPPASAHQSTEALAQLIDGDLFEAFDKEDVA
ncbi:MAG: hypothetical protein KDE51_15470, partial [Anaerolineales bacterium]|nr:hypothetical protein [Anaerolineales bacterium]